MFNEFSNKCSIEIKNIRVIVDDATALFEDKFLRRMVAWFGQDFFEKTARYSLFGFYEDIDAAAEFSHPTPFFAMIWKEKNQAHCFFGVLELKRTKTISSDFGL